MGGEMQKTQEEEEQDLRNSAGFEGSEKSIPVNDDDTEKEVARRMTSLTAGGEEDDPTGFSKPSKIIKGKGEQETAEAVEKPDLKRRRDMWEQSHVEDGGVEPIPDAINTLANLWHKVDEERNRPFTDEEFDAFFLLHSKGDVPKDGLPFLEPKDYQYFGPLLNKEDEEALSPDQQAERNIMKLFLELKNGTPHQMKTALRQLIDYAREFGAKPLLNQILPLLWHPTLNKQERQLMVKVFTRVLYELDELVSPYVRRILSAIEFLLMDEDYNVRGQGTEIIYNLSKTAGLNTMIDALRPDIDNIDEYARKATARSFAVVASALGIAALLPFVKEVCQSRKSWQARHTGFMIVHQIIVSIGSAVLPHSRSLVEIIKLGLNDEFKKVRTVAPLALDALNKFAARYGINI